MSIVSQRKRKRELLGKHHAAMAILADSSRFLASKNIPVETGQSNSRLIEPALICLMIACSRLGWRHLKRASERATLMAVVTSKNQRSIGSAFLPSDQFIHQHRWIIGIISRDRLPSNCQAPWHRMRCFNQIFCFNFKKKKMFPRKQSQRLIAFNELAERSRLDSTWDERALVTASFFQYRVPRVPLLSFEKSMERGNRLGFKGTLISPTLSLFQSLWKRRGKPTYQSERAIKQELTGWFTWQTWNAERLVSLSSAISLNTGAWSSSPPPRPMLMNRQIMALNIIEFSFIPFRASWQTSSSIIFRWGAGGRTDRQTRSLTFLIERRKKRNDNK